jgi:hypothetical protein
VKGLATAFPEIVATLVHEKDAGANEQVRLLRKRLQGIPFHASLKEILVAKNVLTAS